jgi:hypothetical protein
MYATVAFGSVLKMTQTPAKRTTTNYAAPIQVHSHALPYVYHNRNDTASPSTRQARWSCTRPSPAAPSVSQDGMAALEAVRSSAANTAVIAASLAGVPLM